MYWIATPITKKNILVPFAEFSPHLCLFLTFCQLLLLYSSASHVSQLPLSLISNMQQQDRHSSAGKWMRVKPKPNIGTAECSNDYYHSYFLEQNTEKILLKRQLWLERSR